MTVIAVVDYKMGNLLSVERGLRAALESVERNEDVRITSDVSEIARARAIVLPGVGAFADAEASMRALRQKDVIAQRIRDGVPFLGICLGMHLLCDFGVEGAGDECDQQNELTGESREVSADRVVGTSREVSADQVAGGCQETCASEEARESQEDGENQDIGASEEAGASQDIGASLDKNVQPVPGMGFISETVDRLPSHDAQGEFYKVPHVGWNTVEPCSQLREQFGVRFPEQTFDSVAASARELSGDFAPEQEFGSPLFNGINPGEFFYFTHSYFVPLCKQTIATTTHSLTFSSAVQIAPCAFGVQFHPEKSSDAGAKLLENFVRIALAD